MVGILQPDNKDVIIKGLYLRNKELELALDVYGVHLVDCNLITLVSTSPFWRCTCGLEQALKGER